MSYAKENGVFTICASRLDEVRARVEKLNKRGRRIGCPAVAVEVLEEREVKKTRGGKTYTVMEADIRFTGEAPRLAGYTLIASVQHLPAGNVIRDVAVDGTDFAPYRVDGCPVCAHCNTRRARKDTYLLRDSEGALIQIGRNCLADFIRSKDVSAFALRLSFLDLGAEISADYFGGGWSHVVPTVEYLAHACRAVEIDGGFRPSSFDNSTRSTIAFAINRRPAEGGEARAWDELQPGEKSFEKARAILAWVETEGGSSDYIQNLKVALSNPYIDRTEGIVCSAVQAYDRARGIEEQRKAERESRKNEHFSEVGKRLELTLTVTRTHHFETEYGWKALVSLRDTEGRTFLWRGTNEVALDAEPGDVLVGKATIKEHGEYQGTLQTVITRPKFEVRKSEAA